MKIGKWKPNFSKLTLTVILLYVIRVVEKSMTMMDSAGDLSPLAYLLPAIIGWGTITVSFYSWKSKNENVPWNEEQAKHEYRDTNDCDEYNEYNEYNDYN